MDSKKEKKSPELSEQDFIHEGYKKDPAPLWLWLGIIAMVASLMWGGSNWYRTLVNERVSNNPFLQVTNREISLFLWQNSDLMRAHAKKKGNYLPAFDYIGKVGLNAHLADNFVQAPPEIIFRYHIWKRLAGNDLFKRAISKETFLTFLNETEEWKPAFWPEAPIEYITFLNELSKLEIEDLSTVPESSLPLAVRQAYIGWKNYFKEGKNINSNKIKIADLRDFLHDYPHYGRSYWRNIYLELIPDYLKTHSTASTREDDLLDANEMSPFLRLGFYNWQEAKKEG
jgi:hypothetical protein